MDFNAQIRPILNQNCTACHGGVKAAGDISFVYREVTTQVGKKSGRRVIVPGNGKESLLYTLLLDQDPDSRMPTKEKPLPPEAIERVRIWIDQGAAWPEVAKEGGR